MAQIVEKLNFIQNLPQGVTFNKTGEAERMEELFGNFKYSHANWCFMYLFDSCFII